MARKTIPVKAILRMGNHFLAHSEDKQRHERVGVASFMEALLRESGCYAGFGYLPSAQAQTDIDGDGWNAKDDSRRCYYTHKSLL